MKIRACPTDGYYSRPSHDTSLVVIERLLVWAVVALVSVGGWYGIIKGVRALLHWLL